MGGLFSSPKAASTPPPEKINISGPTGSTEFGNFDAEGNFIGDPNIITQRTTESPAQEQIRQQQEQLAIALGSQFGGQLQKPRTAAEIRGIVPSAQKIADGLSGFQQAPGVGNVDLTRGSQQFTGGLPGLSQDFGDLAASAEQATFSRAQNLLTPQFEQSREALEQSLANRGIPITSEAGQKELNRIERSQGAQLENLALSSVGAGRQEAQRLSGLELAQRGALFGEQATQAGVGVQESSLGSQFALGVGQQGLQAQQLAASQRAQELQERDLEFQRSLQKQLSLSNLEAQQRAQQVAEVQGTGLLGTQFQPTPVSALGAGSTGATAGGAGFGLVGQGLGAAATFFSDRRLKENVELVDTVDGLNIYEFTYIDPSYGAERYRGVMAQEVLNYKPEAVIEGAYLSVDYSQLPVNMETV